MEIELNLNRKIRALCATNSTTHTHRHPNTHTHMHAHMHVHILIRMRIFIYAGEHRNVSSKNRRSNVDEAHWLQQWWDELRNTREVKCRRQSESVLFGLHCVHRCKIMLARVWCGTMRVTQVKKKRRRKFPRQKYDFSLGSLEIEVFNMSAETVNKEGGSGAGQ